MTFYEDLVMQTQANYSRYHSVYAAAQRLLRARPLGQHGRFGTLYKTSRQHRNGICCAQRPFGLPDMIAMSVMERVVLRNYGRN